MSAPPSRLRGVLRAVAVDAGLLRRRRDYRLLVGGQFVSLAEGGSVVVALVLVGNAMLPDPHLWVLYVSSALMAAFMALRRPPLDALVPQLVERDELKAAAAIDFLTGNVGMIAGLAAPTSST